MNSGAEKGRSFRANQIAANLRLVRFPANHEQDVKCGRDRFVLVAVHL